MGLLGWDPLQASFQAALIEEIQFMVKVLSMGLNCSVDSPCTYLEPSSHHLIYLAVGIGQGDEPKSRPGQSAIFHTYTAMLAKMLAV